STDSLLKRWNSRFHHTLGNAALALGNFREAEQSYNTAINLRKRENDRKGLSSSLNKLSIVHRMLGNLDQSENYIIEALGIEEELGNRQAIGVTYCTLGILMRQKGERDNAKKYFEDAISNLKVQKNPFLVSVTYYELFLTIVNENISEALMIEDELRKIVKAHSDNYRIAIIYQIVHAIRLNLSKRGLEKFEGQQILKNLQTQVIEDVRLKITVTTRLIFSLLEEYKAFGDQNALDEIKELTEQLYQFSFESNSKFLEGEVMLIKANLELVSGNVNCAHKLMNQAEKFAEELNLRHLVTQIQDSKAHFEKELAYWNEVMQNSSSIMNRITKSRISSYLERMLELIEVGLISE
ncbi:MAG: tetratricopeptide repeat protein, partial [Candidatus Kariarchaeaceae archaeon]